jgi:uncharacterized protein YjbI with pentapeptide repeats
VANPEHVAILTRGVADWNTWRSSAGLLMPDLREADFANADLAGANLANAQLHDAHFEGARLDGADLYGARLHGTRLEFASLNNASLLYAEFMGATLQSASLYAANARDSTFYKSNLKKANLGNAIFTDVEFAEADLSAAMLENANLTRANFRQAVLEGSSLKGADLTSASLVGTDLRSADLRGCRIYGLSAWDVRLDGAEQAGLVISPAHETEVRVDDLEVAQFVYLMLKHEKIRNVIETIGNKAVLILGRFTERKEVLEAISDELRRRGYLPIVFDFERPADRDFSETVMTLTGMSRFVVADITKPRSVPLELHATVPNYMIPFVPIIQSGEEPFAMFRDLWQKYRDWVLDALSYDSVDALVRVFDKAVIQPANELHDHLRDRKAEQLRLRRVEDYQ